MSRYHLAQLNIARMRGPLDSPLMQGFVARLEEINALADRAPGFVWRLQTEDGDATSVRAFDDQLIIVNLSVWESVETLRDYVYGSRHADVLRRRREWMTPMAEAHLAAWWIAAGTTPSVAEAVRRLETLRERGPSPDVFTLRDPHPAPAPTPA